MEKMVRATIVLLSIVAKTRVLKSYCYPFATPLMTPKEALSLSLSLSWTLRLRTQSFR
jgi:hypothetical protein